MLDYLPLTDGNRSLQNERARSSRPGERSRNLRKVRMLRPRLRPVSTTQGAYPMVSTVPDQPSDVSGSGFGALVQQALAPTVAGGAPDHRLWAEIYARLRACLLPWIRRRAAYRTAGLGVDDAFHEVMVQFVKAVRLHQFHYVDERSTLKWFYVTAHHVLSDAERRAPYAPSLDAENVGLPALASSADDTLELGGRLDVLTTEERAIIGWRILGGFSLREISQCTGWGLSRCKHVSASAIEKLRQEIAVTDAGRDRQGNPAKGQP